MKLFLEKLRIENERLTNDVYDAHGRVVRRVPIAPFATNVDRLILDYVGKEVGKK